MKIKAFHIEGFGCFQNVKLDGLGEGLNLFIGANESGKSTLLEFFRQIFFGFPGQRSKLRRYLPPEGDSYGGTLFLVSDEKFSPTSIRRISGTGSGQLLLSFEDGRCLRGEKYLEHLTGGASRELYNNIFAFSLSELQEFNTLRGEDVKNAIYGASLGTGLLDIPKVVKKISKGRDALFLPGGKKQAMAVKIRKIKEIREKIFKAKLLFKEYAEVASRVKVAEKIQEELRTRLEYLKEKERFARKKMAVFDDLFEITSLKAEFKSIQWQSGTFSLESGERFKTLLEVENRLIDGQKELHVELEDIEKRIADSLPDQRIISNKNRIRGILSGAGRYEAEVSRLHALTMKEKELSGQVDVLLSGLGSDWTVERVLEIDRTIVAKEKISIFKERLERLTNESFIMEKRVSDYDSLYVIANEDLLKAEDVCNSIKNRLQEFMVSEDLIRQIEAGRSSLDSLLKDFDIEKRELCELDKSLNDIAASIEKNWRAEQAFGVDISLSFRRSLLGIKEKLDLAAVKKVSLEKEIRALEESLLSFSLSFSEKLNLFKEVWEELNTWTNMEQLSAPSLSFEENLFELPPWVDPDSLKKLHNKTVSLKWDLNDLKKQEEFIKVQQGEFTQKLEWQNIRHTDLLTSYKKKRLFLLSCLTVSVCCPSLYFLNYLSESFLVAALFSSLTLLISFLLLRAGYSSSNLIISKDIEFYSDSIVRLEERLSELQNNILDLKREFENSCSSLLPQVQFPEISTSRMIESLEGLSRIWDRMYQLSVEIKGVAEDASRQKNLLYNLNPAVV